MRKKQLKNRTIAVAAIFFVCAMNISAQVTIGKLTEPHAAAVLDLSQKEATAPYRGLLLPRVSLTDLDDFQLIANPSDEQKSKAAGMTVYNVKEPNPCAAEPIPTGVYTWSGTEWMPLFSGGGLAAGVMKHPKKEGVYEEFYSAEFGSAGRWMTTNLAAHAYDENPHSQGSTLTLSASNSYPDPYWCYPNGGSGGSDATSYNNNPHIGLLYNWSAATAGKGGDTGQKNIYNTSGGTGGNNESNYLEGTVSGQQQRIQGICPKGWHLPSDLEWNELEREIYTNPELYSSYTDNTGWSDPDWQSTWEAGTTSPGTGFRPLSATEAHGKAMKDICGVTSIYDPTGRSNSLADGGFSVLLAGDADDGNARYFGYNTYLWSSSSRTNNFAWYRYLYYANAAVYRYDYTRYSLFSVRCKKD